MGYTITLGEGSTALTLSSDVSLDFRDVSKRINPLGEVESVDWTIDVEGVIYDSDPDVVGSTIFTYLEEVADKFDAVKVTIDQDGTERRVLEPEAGFIGPHVENFRTIRPDEGGSGKSHWRYAFTVTYKSKAFQQQGEDEVYQLHTSLRVTQKNGKVIRKVWKARANSTDVTSAVASVMTFKPSEKFILQEVERYYKTAEAEGVWIWEAQRKGGIKSWRCETRFTGGRNGFDELKMPGVKRDAKLFAKMRGALRIDVRGEIIAFTQDIEPPPDHFKESGTLWRDTSLEDTQVGATIHDELLGEYRLTYHEVYKSVGPTGKPTHSGSHHLIDLGKEPGDGGVSK